jgi:hypothetical protein
MNPDQSPAPPPLTADFAQRVIRRARRTRRLNATLRVAFGLGASLAVAVLVVRPGHSRWLAQTPRASATSALASGLASNDLEEGDVTDPLDAEDGDPDAYFFPDAQADSQLAAEPQAAADDDLAAETSSSEDSEE